MKNNPNIIVLCKICRDEYFDTGKYYIRRINPIYNDPEEIKTRCTRCNYRNGYDYEVIPKDERETMIKRGNIYYAGLNPVAGSEQGGCRPVIVVQNNKGNKHSPTVIVMPITGKLNKNILPTHVLLPKDCGLERDSLVLAEQIRAIDRSRLGSYIGNAGKSVMSQIDRALLISVGLLLTDTAHKDE